MPVTVTTGAAAVDAGYSASLTFDHASLVLGGKALANGNDLRLYHWSGAVWTELDRALDPLSAWDNANTTIWFSLADPIGASSSDGNYYLFYGNASAGSPPDDWANVFLMGDDFDDGSLTSAVNTSTSGTASVSEAGGEAFINLGANELTDSGIIVYNTAIASDRQFAIRHKTRVLSGGGVSNPELKAIGIQESAGVAAVDTSANENPRRRIIDFHRIDTLAQVYYFDGPGSANYWDGAAWQPGNGFWGNLPLDTYYIHELISDGTDWFVRISDSGGTPITTTDPIAWSTMYDTGDPIWFYWGEIYTDFYYGDQRSDWVYLRDYVDPEPTSAVGAEEPNTAYCPATATPTATDTPLPTSTPTPTATDTPLPTNTPTPTATDTPVPTSTSTPTATDTPLATSTPTPTPTPTSTALPSPFDECDYSYRKPITLLSSQVPSDQTDFPVLISISGDSDLSSRQPSQVELAFTASDGSTLLDFEIEDYDAAAGDLVAWVKIPNLSSTADTDIYLYYGNGSASDQQNITGVWSNGFTEVFHFDEISGTHADSTSNGYTGTVSGSVTQNAAGQIDGADELVGPSTTTYITLADGDLGNNAPFTISAWFQVDTSTTWTGIVTKGRELDNDWVGLWANGTQYLFGWDWQGGKGGNVNGSTLSLDTWYYGVGAFDGTSRRLYLDDQLDAGPSAGFYNGITGSNTSVGNDLYLGTANTFDGFIDEVRFSSVARSADWITTEFNNQGNPASFHNVGSEEAWSCGVSVDSSSSASSRPSSMTISHTTAGSDRLMLVGISFNNDNFETVSSVSYNGVALSLVGSVSQADDSRVEIWSLVAPPLGTYDVVITFSTPLLHNATAGVMTFTGVDQATPLGTFASASAASSPGPATVDVTSATNELVFDTVSCQNCTSLTAGAGQTQGWNLATQNGFVRGAGSTEAGASTVTMSWALGAANHWAIGAVPVRPSGGSPPVVDATSTATTAIDSLTFSHTISGSDRLLLVGISFNPNQNEVVSSVTFNGSPLSLVGTATYSNDARAEIWQLVGPDLGTHDVVVTFDATLRYGAVAGAMSFTGVNQSTPLGTFAGNNGFSAGPATVNVSSGTNQTVFDTVACESCTSFTAGAGQTEIWNESASGGSVMGAASTEPGAATVTMSWTLGSSDYWAIGAVPINPS
jgi:hypothetical protein